MPHAFCACYLFSSASSRAAPLFPLSASFCLIFHCCTERHRRTRHLSLHTRTPFSHLTAHHLSSYPALGARAPLSFVLLHAPPHLLSLYTHMPAAMAYLCLLLHYLPACALFYLPHPLISFWAALLSLILPASLFLFSPCVNMEEGDRGRRRRKEEEDWRGDRTDGGTSLPLLPPLSFPSFASACLPFLPSQKGPHLISVPCDYLCTRLLSACLGERRGRGLSLIAPLSWEEEGPRRGWTGGCPLCLALASFSASLTSPLLAWVAYVFITLYL